MNQDYFSNLKNIIIRIDAYNKLVLPLENSLSLQYEIIGHTLNLTLLN
jgi:hypothetical protein